MDDAETVLPDVTLNVGATASFTRADLGALRLTPDRTVRAVNAAFEAVSGLSAEAARHLDVYALVHADDASALRRVLSDAEELVRLRRVPNELPHARARTSQGRPLLWTAGPEVTGDGRLAGFSVVVEDVSATEHASDLALRARPLLDGIPDLVGVADDRGTVVYLNASARSVFGVNDGERVSIERVFAPVAFDQYYREIRPALLVNGSWQGIVQMRRADGSEFRAWQSVTAGIGPTGSSVEWLLSIGRDLATLPQPHAAERREAFYRSVALAIEDARTTCHAVAVIHAALDVKNGRSHPESIAALDRLGQSFGTVGWNDGTSFSAVVGGLTDVVDALRIGHRVCALLAQSDARADWTASAGIALADLGPAARSAKTPDATELIASAERALARARANGGNRTLLA